LTVEQFRILWEADEHLSKFSKEDLAKFNLNDATASFLSIAGLPSSAAPFLTFVQTGGDKFNSICKLRELYDFLEQEFDKYVYIGYDGSGNPIVINTSNNDKIEWLDHEDMFSSNYFNSSINALGSCLIAQMAFIETVNKENGNDAYFNSDFTDSQFEKFRNDIETADLQCLIEEGFWKDCLDVELSMREQYRQTL
jgi:hypothetical protein